MFRNSYANGISGSFQITSLHYDLLLFLNILIRIVYVYVSILNISLLLSGSVYKYFISACIAAKLLG